MVTKTDTEGGGPELDLARVAAILWGGRWLIAGAMLVGLAIGAFRFADTPRVYMAEALLQLEERAGRLALPENISGLALDDPRTTTEIEIIRSRMILGQVVARLNLDWRIAPRAAPFAGNLLQRYDVPLPDLETLRPYGRVVESVALTFLEVGPDLLGRGIVLTVLDPAAADSQGADFRLTLPDGRVRTGRVGELVSGGGADGAGRTRYSVEIGAIAAPPGREYVLAQVPEFGVAAQLRAGLSITEVGRGSGILRLRYRDGDWRRARAILDAIADTYVRQNIDRSAAEADNSLEFIEGQLPDARTRVEAAEGALDAFLRQEDAIDLDFETQRLLTGITGLQDQLSELALREESFQDRYTRNHPLYQQLLAQREDAEVQLASLQSQVDDLPAAQRAVVNLTRNLERAQEVYTQLLVRAQEIQVLRASTVGNVRIIDRAHALSGSIAPDRNQFLVVSLGLGLVVGMALALLRAWFQRGVQDAAQIEAEGLPVFATINQSRNAVSSIAKVREAPIVAIDHPTDLSVEAFRSLRTALHFAMLDATSPSLAITSAAPEAGKSFVSVNLATVLAQSGQRICLVDGDLRRGMLRKYFKTRRDVTGLGDHLAGNATLDDIVRETEIENLSVILTGKYPPNPSELLMRAPFEAMIAELASRFDLVIVDCPPTLAVTDPVVIGRSVGATVVVVRHAKTRLAELRAVTKTFETANVPLAGAILNGFDPKRAEQGGYSYAYAYRYDYRSRDGA
ncbi:MAG: polysaccharide biosynthesis tyrosine autokinase [Shimia sp.]